MSMTSMARLASRNAASPMPSGDPTSVNTHRLWVPSDCTSSTVHPATAWAVSTRALKAASSRSRLTLKLGMHSTSFIICFFLPILSFYALPGTGPTGPALGKIYCSSPQTASAAREMA